MHVKESVKEFVHDVKRRFSHRRKRESCSTCSFDSFDGDTSDSSIDTLHYDLARDSTAYSSITSLPNTPEGHRYVASARPRTTSAPSAKRSPNVLHKIKKRDGKRYRFFSSGRATDASPSDSTLGVDRGIQWSPLSIQDMGDELDTIRSLQVDFSDVIDIRPWPRKTSSLKESIISQSHDSSRTQFDKESHSDTSGTLVTVSSHPKSVSESESRFNFLDLDSDVIAPLVTVIHPMPEDVPVDKPTPPTPPPRTVASPQPASSPSPAPVYIPRLTAPSMFLPIPNTDPLGALLTKHVPAEQRPRRDIAGEYAGRDVHEMVMSNSWRALARMARDKIVASDPEDLSRILDFWSLRLSSLVRLRLTNQASAECTNLFAVLNAVPSTSVPGSFPGSGSLPPSVPLPSSPVPAAPLPLSPSGLGGLTQLPVTPSQMPSALPSGTGRQGANELAYPFELTVFHARVHYWSGDPLGYVDALSRILRRCKERAREERRVVLQRREMGEVRAQVGSEAGNTSQSEGVVEVEGKEGSEIVENAEVQDEDAVEDDAELDEESTEAEDEGAEAVESAKGSADDSDSTEIQEKEQDLVVTVAEANLSMWLERIARVCLILASQMIEMSDYQAAINLLVPLCTHRVSPTFVPTHSPELHSALARVYLLSGDLQKAEEHFSIAASAAGNSANGTDIVVMNTALLAAASGDWTRAEEALKEMVTKDPGNFTAINNLAVTLLSQGRIKEGIDLLEAALKTSPSSAVVAEPFLFNLSTLYELRSTAAIDKKRELLIEVAKWSGDGLRTSCLKMPSS